MQSYPRTLLQTGQGLLHVALAGHHDRLGVREPLLEWSDGMLYPVLAFLTDPEVVVKILRHLGLPTTAPVPSINAV